MSGVFFSLVEFVGITKFYSFQVLYIKPVGFSLKFVGWGRKNYSLHCLYPRCCRVFLLCAGCLRGTGRFFSDVAMLLPPRVCLWEGGTGVRTVCLTEGWPAVGLGFIFLGSKTEEFFWIINCLWFFVCLFSGTPQWEFQFCSELGSWCMHTTPKVRGCPRPAPLCVLCQGFLCAAQLLSVICLPARGLTNPALEFLRDSSLLDTTVCPRSRTSWHRACARSVPGAALSACRWIPWILQLP